MLNRNLQHNENASRICLKFEFVILSLFKKSCDSRERRE